MEPPAAVPPGLEAPGLPENFYFNETGLPNPTNWSVAVGGAAPTYSDFTDSIEVQLLQLTPYNFSVQPVPGFVTGDWNGTVTPTTTFHVLNLTWRPYLLNVTFQESGLPTGVSWGVVLNGTSKSGSSSQFRFSEPNSSAAWPQLDYTVVSVAGYQSNVTTGSVTVNGRGVQVLIGFTAILYAVQWTETGLPPGTNWSIAVASQVLSGAGDSLSVSLANGTYAYRVGLVAGFQPSPLEGNVSVAGGATAVSIVWTAVSYPLTFLESGLPPGTLWSVQVAGATLQGSSTSMQTSLPNGTYAYAVGPVPGYRTGHPSGSVVLSGTGTSVKVTFSAVNYTVSFFEQGLPSGTTWGVRISGASLTGSTPWLNLSVANGSFSWTLGPVAGFRGTPNAGTASVQGQGRIISLAFVPVDYELRIEESGLPAGTNWSVTVSGQPYATGTSYVLLSLPNGTYALNFGPVPGYQDRTTANGSVVIAGNNTSVSVVYVPQVTSQSSSPPLLLMDGQGLLLLFLVALVVGVFVAYLVRRRQNRRRK